MKNLIKKNLVYYTTPSLIQHNYTNRKINRKNYNFPSD